MNKKVKRIIVAGILLIIDWYIYHDSTSNIYAQALVYLVPYLIVGYDVLLEAWEGIPVQ